MSAGPRRPGVHVKPNGMSVPASRNSQKIRVPRDRDYTKVRGLKKLKLILRGFRNAAVLPYKVYRAPEQFRLKDMLGKSRLLVRMDEQGREYRRLSYAGIPREDISTENVSDVDVWRQFEHMRNRVEALRDTMSKPQKHAQFIVHPTGRRGDVYWTGNVFLSRKHGLPRVTVQVGIGDPRSTYFHNKVVEVQYAWSKNEFKLLTKLEKNPRFNFESEKPMMETILAIIKEGLRTRQLRFFQNGYVAMAFNTWKDDPHYLEFYDLKERPKIPLPKGLRPKED